MRTPRLHQGRSTDVSSDSQPPQSATAASIKARLQDNTRGRRLVAKRLTAEQALPDGRSASINAAGVASRTFEAFTNVVIIPFLVVAFAATPRPYLSRLIALVPQRKEARVRYRLASDAHTMPLESCSVTSRSRNFRSAKENETSRDLKSAERRRLSLAYCFLTSGYFMTMRVSLLFVAMALTACAEAPTGTDVSTAATALSVSSGGKVSGEALIGLTNNNELVTFESGKPNQSTSLVPITGLMSGESVVGIDFRPSDLGTNGVSDIGKLYGVTSASRLYVIDPVTGVVSNPVMLSVALNGTSFGIGFNPVVDRLRIHSNTNQNLRINVETGVTIADAPLAYSAGDVNFGNNPDVTATGYTNNDANRATGTELYAIDVAQDVLVEFGAASATSGPNSGRLVTVGALGVDAGLLAGFDISLSSGIAYAVLATSASGKSVLYSIDLDTGAATKLGLLAQTKDALLSVAVRP